MNRRAWLVAGMVLTAPCLLITGVLLLHTTLILAFGYGWSVENRTEEPIWVTPVAFPNKIAGPLPHYSTRLGLLWSLPLGEVLLQSGERRTLVLDGYVASDIGGEKGLVVRTDKGEYRYTERTPDEDIVVKNLTLLSTADNNMIAAVPGNPIAGDANIRRWAIVIVALSAPIVWLVLRRGYRRTKRTP